MSVTAISFPALHLVNVAGMLTQSTTLQQRLPTQSQSSAADHVHLGFRPYTDEELRPKHLPMLIVAIEELNQPAFAAGGGRVLGASGVLAVDFYTLDRYTSARDSYIDAWNFIGGVWEDFRALVNVDGNLNLEAIESEVPLVYSGLRNGCKYWFSRQSIHWGM